MTALKDVLTVEQEAEQAIATAKNEVAADVAAAKTNGQKKKAAQKEEQKKAEKEAINNKEQKIAQKIKAIEVDAQSEISEVEKRFAAKHDEIKTLLIEQL